MRTIVDALGIRHKLERGASRNTRCGRAVAGDVDRGGDVDCMACVGGPSLLSLRDLRDGVEVVAWVQVFDRQGNQAGNSAQVTFTDGMHVHGVSIAGLAPGTVLVGHRYHDEDGRTIWINKWERPIAMRKDLEFRIEAGARVV